MILLSGNFWKYHWPTEEPKENEIRLLKLKSTLKWVEENTVTEEIFGSNI